MPSGSFSARLLHCRAKAARRQAADRSRGRVCHCVPISNERAQRYTRPQLLLSAFRWISSYQHFIMTDPPAAITARPRERAGRHGPDRPGRATLPLRLPAGHTVRPRAAARRRSRHHREIKRLNGAVDNITPTYCTQLLHSCTQLYTAIHGCTQLHTAALLCTTTATGTTALLSAPPPTRLPHSRPLREKDTKLGQKWGQLL
jgi:hypothetical protein